MRRLIANALVGALLGLGCHQAAKPCSKECTDISGQWKETSQTSTYFCGSYSLNWEGGKAEPFVTQKGSALTLTVAGITLQGTLFENSTVRFGETKVPIYSLDTGQPVSTADLTLDGSFKGGAFSGTYHLADEATADCTVTSSAVWVR